MVGGTRLGCGAGLEVELWGLLKIGDRNEKLLRQGLSKQNTLTRTDSTSTQGRRITACLLLGPFNDIRCRPSRIGWDDTSAIREVLSNRYFPTTSHNPCVGLFVGVGTDSKSGIS